MLFAENVLFQRFSTPTPLFSTRSMEKSSKFFNNNDKLLACAIRRREVLLRFSSSSEHLYEFKYRDRTSIISDILKTVTNSAGKGKRKTQIMQSANLNFDQVNKYLSFLIGNGYLKIECPEIHGGPVYRATSKGLNFVKFLETEKLRVT